MARIKYGNFMITSLLGAITSLMVAFQRGSGTILGAFLGSIVLALLLDGFNLIGISANIILFIFGAAVLLAMVVNVQLARVRAAGRA